MYLDQLKRQIRFRMEKCLLLNLLNEASHENLTETVCVCFYLRDIHLGLGKRQMGRWAFEWISIYHPQLFLRLMLYIPYYGRWDDLLYIQNASMENFIFQFYSTQIHTDLFNLSIGAPISLCSKWLPTEGKSFAKKFPDKFEKLLKFMNMNKKQYRKRVSTLRAILYLPERVTCQQVWWEAEYNRYSKTALQKHHTTFRRQDRENFDKWLAQRPPKEFSVKPKLDDVLQSNRYAFVQTCLQTMTVD